MKMNAMSLFRHFPSTRLPRRNATLTANMATKRPPQFPGDVPEEGEEEEVYGPDDASVEGDDNGGHVVPLLTGVALQTHRAAAWEWWRSMGSPKFWVAPMVDGSELPFRMLCRDYGCTGAYTPMFSAYVFNRTRQYRARNWSVCPGDRPVGVQFAARAAEDFLGSALQVQDDCDFVDLNLGCPQRIAKRGRFGAFAWGFNGKAVLECVHAVATKASVPVTVKIRVQDTLEQTLDYVRALEAAGASMIAVHGRTKENKGHNMTDADWSAIAAVKAAVGVPVLANGNIASRADALRCMEETGADGVMSAVGLLRNPLLFAEGNDDGDDDGVPRKQLSNVELLRLYLDYVERYADRCVFTQRRCMMLHTWKLFQVPFESTPWLRMALVKEAYTGGQKTLLEAIKGLRRFADVMESFENGTLCPKQVQQYIEAMGLDQQSRKKKETKRREAEHVTLEDCDLFST